MPLRRTQKSTLRVTALLNDVRREQLTLSTYFPRGTQFFYGYPSGDNSGFLNLVSPATEELVAGRVVCCSGENVLPVCFSGTTSRAVPEDTLRYFGIANPPKKTIIIPENIGPDVSGLDRNNAVKDFLKISLRPKSFVMAQPYLDDELMPYYQIEPSVTHYFNDKHHMPDYIGPQWLPKRHYAYEDGKEFAESDEEIALPAVIKVSASSSGDGVSICKTAEDILSTKQRFFGMSGRIIVEEHIDFQKSYGVHFGIPADSKRPADLIGVNEQITTVHGEFLGGIIEHFEVPPALEGAIDHLMNFILPRVRQKGWHGVGGFDVLVDSHGKAYYIDANFRMTGMSAYHFLIDNGIVKRPMVSMQGEFTGNDDELRHALGKFAAAENGDRFLKIICLSRHGDTWRFNGALEYSNEKELFDRAKVLLDAGVNSPVLQTLHDALSV